MTYKRPYLLVFMTDPYDFRDLGNGACTFSMLLSRSAQQILMSNKPVLGIGILLTIEQN